MGLRHSRRTVLEEGETHLNVWPAFADLLVLMVALLLLAGLVQVTSSEPPVPPKKDGGGDGRQVAMYKKRFGEIVFVQNSEKLKSGDAGEASVRRFVREDLPAWVQDIRRDSPVQDYLVIVEIAGHADIQPFDGDPFGNWRLSSARALSVLQIVMNEVRTNRALQRGLSYRPEHVNRKRGDVVIRLASFGEHLPVRPYPDETWKQFRGRPKREQAAYLDPNRRLEIRVYAEPHAFPTDTKAAGRVAGR